ncbi:MAG: MG2 domain-containing protein, partial [Rhodanobacteraceae bacterium]
MARGSTLLVRRISPSGDDVQPGEEAVIQFDRAMVPLGHMGRKAATLPVSISPDPGCQWRWLDTSELACRLPKQQHFAPATEYTVTVGTALKALDGSHLDVPLVQTFTTWRPKVIGHRFEGWHSPVIPSFRVRLNMRVTAKQLAAHIGFEDSAGDWVGARVEPYTKEREGPIWLRVPGTLGAVVEVVNPKPGTPLDAHAAAAAGRRVWLVIPAKPLVASTKYTLQMKPGMRSPLGPLPGAQADGLADMLTYGDFTFSGVGCNRGSVRVSPGDKNPPRCTPSDIDLLFSAPVPRATLAAIRWRPLPLPRAKLAAKWRDYPQWFLLDRRGSTDARNPDSYPLTFVLDPMQAYTLTVPSGVKDSFGRELAKPVSVTVLTDHRLPFASPPPSEAVLEADQSTIAPIRFTNLDSFTFDYRRISAGELAKGSKPAASQTEGLLARPDLDVKEDHVSRGSLGVRRLLDGHSGVVWGSLQWSPNGPWRPYRFMGEVTPYQVLAKVGHYGTLVWVNHLDSSKPVAGARVKWLHGHDNDLDPLVTFGGVATTNAYGLAELPGAAKLPKSWFRPWKDRSNFYVGVARGDDVALLPLDRSFERALWEASNDAFWSNTAPPHGHMRAWAVTEQGIYKPGSDVQYAVFVRAEGATTLAEPPALDYTLTISDPQGNKILQRTKLQLSAYGGVHGRLHISKNAPMGRYRITLSWPTMTGAASRDAGHFIVTDFVPATFKVHTLVEGKRFGPGDNVTTRVSATLHAGGPYTDAMVKFTTRLVPRWFSPDTPVASGFSFGSRQEPWPNAQTIAETHGVLDHTGYAKATITLPARSKVIYGEVRVEASVESSRATWVANDASVPYAARDRFVGLRTKNWMQTAAKPFKVEYLVVDADGRPEAGSKVELKLQRQAILRVRVKNGAGDFTYEEHTRWITDDHCKAVSENAPASCELTPKQAGDYRVIASVIDTRGRRQRSELDTWVTGAGEVVWSRKGKGVTLVPDKSSYHVGDVAHVLVQNPYPGARALVTIERYGVLWKKVVTLKGSAPVIDVPIGTDCFPGAYLSVAIFSPRVSPLADPDLGRPELALGYVALKITGKGSSLGVRVTPARATYKPRQTVDVAVAVKAANGKVPGKTRLVVAVVDQGVLDLLQKGTKYYDPRATFYAPPDGPDVVNYSLAEQLLTRLQPKQGKGESPGGGGGKSSGPNVRSNFSYAVYWNPSLETDASGHAHFSFKLPDNLTRWRVLVIAMSPSAAMGLGDGSVRVNLPLQIEPALPNQMHVGDRFGAAFNVTNRTTKSLDVTTHVTASGALGGGKAESRHKLKLGSFAHGLSWLQLVASRPGDITFTASAKAGKLSDAVRVHIPVHRAGVEVVAAEYGSTTGAGARVPVKVPLHAIPGNSRITVTFAPTLVGGLTGAFEVMRDDPLNTWEVRLSRGVLASDYLKLKPVVGNSMRWPDAGKVIGKMLTSAADFQAPDGGMAFWIPGNRFVSPYLSVYTALAFDWLEDAGHQPPTRVRQKLWGYLHSDILDKDASWPVLRAGAMAAIALAPDGRLPEGAVGGMLPKLHRMRLFGQALLLEAAIASHDRKSADAIAKSLLSYAEESAGEISFNEDEQGAYLDLLATPLRSNCAILDALSRYKAAYGQANLVGATPQKLMRWVAGQRRNAGGWPNGQENVFCTTATTHFADVYENTPVKALTGTLELPEQKPQHAAFSSR